MSKLFEPVGDMPRWKMAYLLLVDTPVGGTVTYDDLAEALGLDPDSGRALAQSAVRRAMREYEAEDLHAVEVVRNVGYRVVDTGGHLRLARLHSRKAATQQRLGRSKVVNVDLSGVEPEVRKGFEVVAQAFAQQAEINRRILDRQRRTDKSLSEVVQRTKRTDEELTDMRQRLADMESRLLPESV